MGPSISALIMWSVCLARVSGFTTIAQPRPRPSSITALRAMSIEIPRDKPREQEHWLLHMEAQVRRQLLCELL
jgi:hypothetical protein